MYTFVEIIGQQNVRKYLYDKENPKDPTKRLQMGAYNEDTINCTAIVDAENYKALKAFLTSSALNDGDISGFGLYIRTHVGNEEIGYPITSIQKLPTLAPTLASSRAKVAFEFLAKYTGTPHLPAFINYGFGNYGADNYGF